MNTYRLIRATQHLGSRSSFLGGGEHAGEHQAVLTLLAVAAGYPAMADRLLVALQEDATRNDIHRWPDFVRELCPADVDRPAGRLVPADLAGPSLDPATRNELATWKNLCEGLTVSLTSNGLADLEPYQRWARIVARRSPVGHSLSTARHYSPPADIAELAAEGRLRTHPFGRSSPRQNWLFRDH